MPKSKFESIYKDLKVKIESGDYEFQSILPSENTMVEIYDCSRNTIRRALAHLTEAGYLQPMHGKGVRVIYQPVDKANFVIGGIETFQETAIRNQLNSKTEVVTFAEIVADERIVRRSGFTIGTELYYIQRLRILDGIPSILDINLFAKDIIPGLTPEIASKSVYEYIENTLKMEIVTSKRKMTVERISAIDEKYLELNDCNCLAVVTSQTYNGKGVMFEYTQSRHVPDYFCFQDIATRRTIHTD